MKNLSIYIHWPFCKSKCPYCDFNSHVRAQIDEQEWQNALLAELAYYAGKLPGRQVVSIFFGGGTPSLMPTDTVAALIDAAGKYWQLSKGIEITLEANPTSIEAQKFRDFHKTGINRVSIGVQSLSPTDLAFLGREHNVNEALDALSVANEIFSRVSFDLIYARPNQTPVAWEKELRTALIYAKDHISLYQLTIEENTAFHHIYHNGGFVLPEEGLCADMYMLTQDITEAHGLPAYEISNHAKPGQESRHNLAYWNSHDYIGIGPGAHGRYRSEDTRRSISDASAGEISRSEIGDSVSPIRLATENIKSPERWLESVQQSGNGITSQTPISGVESLEEAVMMGLRLSSGIVYKDWRETAGINIHNALSQKAINKLQKMELVVSDAYSIKTTRQGRLLLNSITRELLAA